MTKPPIKIGRVGKNNSLFLAFLVGGFLFWQSADISYSKTDGWVYKSRPVPIQVSFPCFLVMAVALGINIRDELMIIALAVSRNSAAIAELAEQAQQQQQQLPQESEQIEKKDDQQQL